MNPFTFNDVDVEAHLDAIELESTAGPTPSIPFVGDEEQMVTTPEATTIARGVTTIMAGLSMAGFKFASSERVKKSLTANILLTAGAHNLE